MSARLTPAERQRRYREKLKQDPTRYAVAREKQLARYRARKKLIQAMPAKSMCAKENCRCKRRQSIATRPCRNCHKL